MNAAIKSYGVYVPINRLKVEDIAKIWNKRAADIELSLGVKEKSVASIDEDAVTLGFEACCQAIKNAGIRASQIETLLVGSESHPYAVNPTSTILGEFLGLGENYLAADLEFACKAATSGMIAIAGLISAKEITFGMAVGTDCAQAKPHDVLEYTAASAAAAFILGPNDEEALAEIVDFTSFTSDTPDFWRRDGVRFPSHGGRFTGEPGYFTHVEKASRKILAKNKLKPADFNYCVFHMPNGKFPRIAAKRLGFTQNQLQDSLIIDQIGNPYTASTLIGLAQVLDKARKNDLIFLTSYGSGAGSDSFIFKVKKDFKGANRNRTFKDYLKSKKYISYTDYLKFLHKI